MSEWIRASEIPDAPKFYYFEKEFDAPKDATLTASSCGDTRYVLYLNGHLVSEGPCQGSQYQTYYETEDLTPSFSSVVLPEEVPPHTKQLYPALTSISKD